MSPSRPRLVFPSPIPGRLVSEHHRLSDLLQDLRNDLPSGKNAAPVGGMQLVLIRSLLADVARLLSREPGGRALLRLPRGETVPLAAVVWSLRDAAVALAAFRRAHSDGTSEREDGWLVEHRRGRLLDLSSPEKTGAG